MIYSSSGRRAYGVKEFIFDTYEDMLKENNMNTGDTAFVMNTSKYYMLNHQKQWIEIFPHGSAAGGGGETNVPVVYDGGTVKA